MATNPDTLVKFAVHDIVNQINDGMDPQAATEKVARELKLNPQFIKRASEAINVALHYNHFKKHAEARADDFPIVDAQKIADDIFGTQEKTASQFRSELFSSFQAEEITPKFARYLEDGPHKEAYAKLINEKAVTKFDMSERGVYEKAANYIRDLKKEAQDKRAEACEAEYQTNRSFCKILEKFARAEDYRTSFHEFESQAFAIHGEKAVPYLDLLYKTSQLKEARGKRDSSYKMFSPCEEVNAFGAFLKNAEELASVKEAATDAEHNFKFENDYIQDTFQKRGCELFNKVAQIDSTIAERVEAELKKEAETIENIPVADPVLAAVKAKKTTEFKKKEASVKEAFSFIDSMMNAAKSEGKPSVAATSNSEMDNRNRAFLLQELATTDPILSKQHPKKVVDSYQQMLRLAPEISNEKELVRAFLRQSTASQAIGPFEGQQLVEADTKLLKQRMLQKGLPESGGWGGEKKI
jgi:hypothetical protein